MDAIGLLQIIPLIGAVVGLLFDRAEDDTRKRVVRWLSICAIGFSMAAMLYGRREFSKERFNREEVMRQQLAHQRQQIESLKKIQSSQEQNLAKADQLAETQDKVIEGQDRQLGLSAVLGIQQSETIQEITRLSLDRYLSALEISYKPSSARWAKITSIYRTLKPGTGDPSYYDALITAERTGDGWAVVFGWARIIEDNKDKGVKKFPTIFASDKDTKGFARLFQEAIIPLSIRWADDTETDIEPLTKQFPPVISISRESIVLTLRPPFLNLYLGDFRRDPSIVLRTRADYPRELRFRCVDGNVKCDEIIRLKWEPDNSAEPPHRLKPLTDRVRLHPRFRIASG